MFHVYLCSSEDGKREQEEVAGHNGKQPLNQGILAACLDQNKRQKCARQLACGLLHQPREANLNFLSFLTMFDKTRQLWNPLKDHSCSPITPVTSQLSLWPPLLSTSPQLRAANSVYWHANWIWQQLVWRVSSLWQLQYLCTKSCKYAPF